VDPTKQPAAQIIHQHPLAYLLGLEGIALMRAFAGEHDRAFTEARFAEVRRLLDDADGLGPGVDVPALPVAGGYDGWAVTYDGEDNGCFPMRDDVLTPMLDRLTPGRALDAACGTGAVAQRLVERGHDVIGVDLAEHMLARARKVVRGASFVLGDITDLPLPDGDVDHVVCSLALTHLADLRPFFAEAARVMRPGGHLVLLDTRGHFTGSTRYPLIKQAPDGRVGYVAGYSHSLGDYLRAALPPGYVVRACEEVPRDADTVGPDEEPAPLTPGPPDIWELHPWARGAANAAKAGQAAVVDQRRTDALIGLLRAVRDGSLTDQPVIGDTVTGSVAASAFAPGLPRVPVRRVHDLGLVLHVDTLFGDGPAADATGQLRGLGRPDVVDPESARTLARNQLREGTGVQVIVVDDIGAVQHVVRLDRDTARSCGSREAPVAAVRQQLAQAPPLQVDTHDPSEAMARHARAAAPTCSFYDCPRQARSCDLDHDTPWPRGPTSVANLDPKCRRHHNAKTLGVAQTRLSAGPGAGRRTVHWTLPAGLQVITTPERLPGVRRYPTSVAG
jgi:SAM-dependent methyltransferase